MFLLWFYFNFFFKLSFKRLAWIKRDLFFLVCFSNLLTHICPKLLNGSQRAAGIGRKCTQKTTRACCAEWYLVKWLVCFGTLVVIILYSKSCKILYKNQYIYNYKKKKIQKALTKNCLYNNVDKYVKKSQLVQKSYSSGVLTHTIDLKNKLAYRQ